MPARYAGDIFYRPLTQEEDRDYGQKSELVRRFTDLRLLTPEQKEFQKKYLAVDKLISELA